MTALLAKRYWKSDAVEKHVVTSRESREKAVIHTSRMARVDAPCDLPIGIDWCRYQSAPPRGFLRCWLLQTSCWRPISVPAVD